MRDGKMQTENARFADWVQQALRRSQPVFTYFLTPDAQQQLCALARAQGLMCGLFAGCDEPERAIVGLWLTGCDPEISPVRILKLSWDGRYAAPEHRDVLGAYLGLGLERETLGEIRLDESCAYMAVEESVVSYVCSSFESVGRAKVKIQEVPEGHMPAAKPGSVDKINVPSQRLDCVVAQVFKLSRSKAQALIAAGLVQLNWKQETRSDVQVDENDLISARGNGRVRIRSVLGRSRKDRLFLEVERFGNP